MGVKEILLEFLQDVDEPARGVIADVLLAEQKKLDMERPRLKDEIREIIDAHVRREEGQS
jgi:hypothetical protein